MAKPRNYAGIIAGVLVVLAATLIFVMRNRSPFVVPNLYAEDATIFYHDVLTRNPIAAIFGLFNGYLVIGQYLIAYAAFILNTLVGGTLEGLVKSTALVSSAFLGFTVSLPFLLFRKQLGTLLSLATVALTAFVPMTNSSYVIIGTIGNLKFAFLYSAFLLVLYRNLRYKEDPRILYGVDAALLLCVLTNASAVLLLPFLLWPYRGVLLQVWRKRRWNRLHDPGLISLAVLLGLAALYVVAVYARGIPPLPGYLDTPYRPVATLPLLQRATLFAWLYPITSTFHSKEVLGLFVVLGLAAWTYAKRDRFVLVLGVWAMVSSVALFTVTRPGVSEYFLNYKHNGGPDQFFYAQNFIAIFVAAWLVRGWVAKRKAGGKALVAAGTVLFLTWAVPYGTAFKQGEVQYQSLGTIRTNLQWSCRGKENPVHIQVYPASNWYWTIDRAKVCGRQ